MKKENNSSICIIRTEYDPWHINRLDIYLFSCIFVPFWRTFLPLFHIQKSSEQQTPRKRGKCSLLELSSLACWRCVVAAPRSLWPDGLRNWTGQLAAISYQIYTVYKIKAGHTQFQYSVMSNFIFRKELFAIYNKTKKIIFFVKHMSKTWRITEYG